MSQTLTPANCDLRDFPAFKLDVNRLRDSDLTLLSSGEEFKAAVLLWAASWHQVPASSLPADERLLAGLARVEQRRWPKVRGVALRGWEAAEDGRLYHPVIAEKALECWIEKLLARISSGAGHAKRYGTPFDRTALDADLSIAFERLRVLAPKSRVLSKAQKRTSEDGPDEPASDTAGGSPGGAAGGMAREGKGREGSNPPEGASAPDFNKEAWAKAVSLLTGRGGMKEKQARSFFGQLLRNSSLQASDLLPSLVRLDQTGSLDPQGYLTKAAEALAQRRPDAPTQPNPNTWDDEIWATAVEMHRADGSWSDRLGPPPGMVGCRVPPAVLAEAGR